LIQDADVPFVRTIARITQEPDGSTAEYQLPLSMPELLGAGAEFIPASGLMQAGPGILDLDALLGALEGADSVLIGHIFGGIRSPQPNVFWIEDGTLSSAYPKVLAVWLKRPISTGMDLLNAESRGGLRLQVYPNPSDGAFSVSFLTEVHAEASLRIFSAQGQLLEAREFGHLPAGRHVFALALRNPGEGLYLVELLAGSKATVQVVLGDF
jgi:hypothetical protein